MTYSPLSMESMCLVHRSALYWNGSRGQHAKINHFQHFDQNLKKASEKNTCAQTTLKKDVCVKRGLAMKNGENTQNTLGYWDLFKYGTIFDYDLASPKQYQLGQIVRNSDPNLPFMKATLNRAKWATSGTAVTAGIGLVIYLFLNEKFNALMISSVAFMAVGIIGRLVAARISGGLDLAEKIKKNP